MSRNTAVTTSHTYLQLDGAVEENGEGRLGLVGEEDALVSVGTSEDLQSGRELLEEHAAQRVCGHLYVTDNNGHFTGERLFHLFGKPNLFFALFYNLHNMYVL